MKESYIIYCEGYGDMLSVEIFRCVTYEIMF